VELVSICNKIIKNPTKQKPPLGGKNNTDILQHTISNAHFFNGKYKPFKGKCYPHSGEQEPIKIA
jgi:hypothetical protein